MYALLGSCDQVTGKQASTSLSAQQWEGVGEKEDVGRRVSRTPSEVKSKVRKTEHAMCLLNISGILRNGDRVSKLGVQGLHMANTSPEYWHHLWGYAEVWLGSNRLEDEKLKLGGT